MPQTKILEAIDHYYEGLIDSHDLLSRFMEAIGDEWEKPTAHHDVFIDFLCTLKRS